ncbi:MAG: ribonuclease P protein component [Actinomycetota bacterium]
MKPAPISKPEDFKRAFARGRRARRDGLTVHVVERSEASLPTRLGIVVERSAGGAVVRNKIKRRIREAFRSCCPSPGHDVVVRGDADVRDIEFQELVIYLKTALTRTEVV